MTVPVQSPAVQAFIDALLTLETDRDPSPLADLVTEDAEVVSIDGHGPRRGPGGMRELFTQYLAQFDRVETTFVRVTENDTRAALEWSSDAVLVGGSPVTYTGMTVLDHADGRLTRFRTLYDSGALLRPRAGARPVVGHDDADSGVLPEADRAAPTGRDQ